MIRVITHAWRRVGNWVYRTRRARSYDRGPGRPLPPTGTRRVVDHDHFRENGMRVPDPEERKRIRDSFKEAALRPTGREPGVIVHWHEQACDWHTKYCDEHHRRSARVSLADLEDIIGRSAKADTPTKNVNE